MCCPAENYCSVGVEQKMLANTGDADMRQHQKQAACQTSQQVDSMDQETQTQVPATAAQQQTFSLRPDVKQSTARYRSLHPAMYVDTFQTKFLSMPCVMQCWVGR